MIGLLQLILLGFSLFCASQAYAYADVDNIAKTIYWTGLTVVYGIPFLMFCLLSLGWNVCVKESSKEK